MLKFNLEIKRFRQANSKSLWTDQWTTTIMKLHARDWPFRDGVKIGSDYITEGFLRMILKNDPFDRGIDPVGDF